MPLSPGARLGPYEIVAPLGAGGMGEVYRARDTRLKRDVAIKILPDAFAADPERLARFQREAELLATLNHPHIAQIHGLEARQEAGHYALILELVDGPTLADRIAQGPIPVSESLAIARQIAEALEAAHENGIVHRDLKPANIKLTADGVVKVLDFGLAKAAGASGSGLQASGADLPASALTHSPTITSPAMQTHAGIILGTAVYMSPEQAKGRPTDKRSDIWSFGCVLFEMLTGARAFDGEDLTDVVAAVVRGEPDWKRLPAELPDHVRTLVQGCLQKDRKARIGDIAVARFLLDQPATPPAATVAGITAQPPRARVPIAWMAAGLVVVAAAGLALVVSKPWQTSPVRSAPLRLMVDVGSGTSLSTLFGAVALSPDGSRMAFVGSPSGTNPALFLRRLDQLEASQLAGTEGAVNPFFSPDGEWIGFFAQGKLKKVPVTGGTPITVCDAPNPRGAAWSDDGWIYFIAGQLAVSPGVTRVRDEGGAPETIPNATGKEIPLRWPQVLPGSKTVLYTSTPQLAGTYAASELVVFSLIDRTSKVVLQDGYYGRYLPSGHLVYVKGSSLFAVPFDVQTLSVTGRSVPILEGIATNSTTGSVQFSVSDQGTFVYVPGDSTTSAAPVRWIDRTGKTEVFRTTEADWSNPSFSPDGQKLAMDISDGAQTDIWVYEQGRDTTSRLTFDRADDLRPVWSPGGRYIAFASRRNGQPNLYMQRSDGTGEVIRLTDSPNNQFPASWHPGGKYLAFFEIVPGRANDAMVLPLEGDEGSGYKPGKPQAFLSAPHAESSPMFSPDGRWLAYISNESGRNEIFVRPFPGPGGKWQISSGLGDDPTWSRTSNEILYLSPADVRMMSVSYRAQGDSFQADKPVVWVDTPLGGRPRPPSRDLDLHPDGKRVVFGASEQKAFQQNRVVLVSNFSDELKRLAPSKGQ